MMSSTATPRMRYHHHQPQRHRSPHFYLQQQICHPQPARGRVTTVACCCVGVCCVAHFSLSDTSRRAAVSVMSAFGSTQTPTTTTTGTGTGTTGGGGALVGGGVNSGGISRGSAMGGVGGGIHTTLNLEHHMQGPNIPLGESLTSMHSSRQDMHPSTP